MRKVGEIAASRPATLGYGRPTRAEIDLDVVVANATALKSTVGPRVAILAVVKADAYGHGAVPVARALAERAPVAGLAVSLVEEGLELRRGGVTAPVLVMGGVYRGAHLDMLAHDLVPVVSELPDLEGFAHAARATGGRAEVHVKIDTGMSRLGLRPEALPAFIAALRRWPEIDVVGACTHLACADAADEAPTREQLRRFDDALAALAAGGIRPRVVHAANTAATLRFPEARYGAVRPGLAVYQGAMRLVSAVAQLRWIEAGDAVSYGALWRAPRRARIATLPVGYADGYPRRLTGAAEVLIHGRRCPVVGAVCMDMTLVDVTALGDAVAVGDEAVLLGAQGGERVTAAELAERAGLIEYEITCGVSKRVPRVYLMATTT